MATRKTATPKDESAEVKKAPAAKKESPAPEPKKAKKFGEEDPVRCMSLFAGRLGMIGQKSGINYKWVGRGDEIDVEYRDLVAAYRMRKKQIMEPLFVVKDEDFLNEFPELKSIYSALYGINDLADILKYPPEQMKEIILSLPEGAKASLQNVVATEIQNGSIDSIQKIRMLDEIFDTQFMLMTDLFK